MATPENAAGRVGARLTVKGAMTQARIVDAAAALIFERRIARTGIEDVERAAEVSASRLSAGASGRGYQGTVPLRSGAGVSGAVASMVAR